MASFLKKLFPPYVGVLRIDTLVDSQSSFKALIGLKTINKYRIKGLVLVFNSNGGSYLHAEKLQKRISRVKRRLKIPVYTVIEESASGPAFNLAVCSDKVFASPTSIIGNQGFFFMHFDASKMLSGYGVEGIDASAPKYTRTH